jgi:hypothetical protein
MSSPETSSPSIEPVPVRISTESPAGENGVFHPSRTVDEEVYSVVHAAQEKIGDRYAEFENYVRRSPGPAMATAFAAGYLLKMLPVEAIVAAQVRLALSLVRPALFLYGSAKVCEMMLRRKH